MLIFITLSHKPNMNHSFKIIISSSLSSRLELLRFIVLMFISLLKNVTISECIYSRFISRLENTTSLGFLSISLVTSQSGASFNADRQPRPVLSRIFWVLHLSGFFGNNFITHFLSLILIRNIFYCRRINTKNFILLFTNKKLFCFAFSYFLACTNPTILLDAMLQTLTLCFHLFYMLYVV